MLLALTAGAQSFTVEKSPNPLGVQAPAFGAFKAPAKANLAANQRLVGYFDTDDCDNYVGVTNFTGNNKVAIELTADDLAPYYGKKITGVRFNLGQGQTANGVFVQNLTLENGQIVDMADVATSDKSVTSAAGATNTGEWHEVMFDNKVELSSSFQELFVGFNYKQTSSNYPIGVNSNTDGPFFVYANIPASQGGSGETWYQFQSGGMSLAIQLIVEGAFSEDTAYVYAKASVESLVSGDYDIAYMLVADNLSGTTKSWKQSNYFAKGSGVYNSQSSMPEDLQFLWDAGSSYAATYNDVLISSSYVSSKNKATLPSLVANGSVNSYYTLTMPTKKALKEAIRSCGNEVYVIAMVLDKKTGAIVNARKAKVADFGTTGIENVNNSSEATVVARYNVNGVQIAAPVKGINIVKMSDGTTRKVLVK